MPDNLDIPGAETPGSNPEQLSGPADGDSGQGQANPAESASNVPSEGQASKSSQANIAVIPGKRLKNPLGEFASMNYQLSLYMITPDAYDAFILSGRKNINAFSQIPGNDSEGGAFLVAQSGGINNTSSRRAPGFNYDYGIDNLSFNTSTSGKENETSTNTSEFKFTITEPYGFSFISKLKEASEALSAYADQTGAASSENPLKQFFILGIKFYGYDIEGNIITGNENFADTTLDPDATGNGVFARYYDIIISSIKFKIEGKASTYQIEAKSMAPQLMFSVKRGMINNDRQVTASTVGQAIQSLFDKLNTEQEEEVKKKARSKPNKYEVVYLSDARQIEEASIVLPEDLDKFKWPGSGAKTTAQSNAGVEVKSQPNNTTREITFKSDTPILQAINQVISQSAYLRDALQVVYTTAIQPDPKKDSEPENKPNTKKTIKWYNCSGEVSNAVWDDVIGDWAWTMTYLIQTYETPVIDSAYANPGTTYYGPHKRYEYWYTGKNTEVLQYSQQMDNLYYNVALNGGTGTNTESSATGGNNANAGPPGTAAGESGNATNGPTSVPKVPNKRTSQPRLGKLGVGMEAQNNYLTSLFDPGAYAKAKITILGDPDFLIQDSASSQNEVYSRFYGNDGFTINANGGQVFIEIDFKEPIDYDNDVGYLSINDSILFWKYPENVSKLIKGVSYMVVTVTSTFAGGSFKQTIDAVINDFGDTSAQQNDQARPAANSPSNAGQAPSTSKATTQSTGLTPDNPSKQSKPVTSNAEPVNTPQVSPDDDNTGTTYTPII